MRVRRAARCHSGLFDSFTESQANGKFLVAVSIAEGKTIKTLQMPTANGKTKGIDWLPDGNGLMYVLSDSEYKNKILWLQPLDGEVPREIAELGDEEIEHFSLSPDGKSFAVVQGDWKHDAILIEGLR